MATLLTTAAPPAQPSSPYNRSSSAPSTHHRPTTSSTGSSNAIRPLPTLPIRPLPLPNHASSHSTSSLPRLHQQPMQLQPQPQQAHYPFLPSPGLAAPPLGFVGAPSPGPGGPPLVDQRLLQAQLQQQAWQLEMMRQHQMQQQQQQHQMLLAAHQHQLPPSRRRATSGPAPTSHSSHPPYVMPSYYPASPPPAPHGYLTPPASDQGAKDIHHLREHSHRTDSAGSFHPYRRDTSPTSVHPSSPYGSYTPPQRRTETPPPASPAGPPLLSFEHFPPLSAPPPPRGYSTAPTPPRSNRSSPVPSVRERERPSSRASSSRASSTGSGSINSGRTTPTAPPPSVAVAAKKPSPLGSGVNTPAREDQGEESDDTAEAVTMPGLSGGLAVGSDKKKGKGVGARFKKAFGGSSSGDKLGPGFEIDGRGPSMGSPASPHHTRGSSTSSTDSSPNPKTPPPPKPRSGRFGSILSNSKLNSSTDNISISSTVSSASVMIRKIGNLGSKLVRRNSLMSLTKAFKSKNGDDGKGGVVEARTSHVTAEMDAADEARGSGLVNGGISPAAALARKHQEIFKAQEEELLQLQLQLQHQRKAKTTDDVIEPLQAKKEKAKRGGRKGFLGLGGVKAEPQVASSLYGAAFEIEDNDDGDHGVDEDGGDTPRQSMEIIDPPTPTSTFAPAHARTYSTYSSTSYLEDVPAGPGLVPDDEYEPSLVGAAATSVPRRDPQTIKGILKRAGTYNQEDYIAGAPSRPRANSFDAPGQQGRPGSPGNAALVGRIPTEAQVDGLVPSTTSQRTDSQPPLPSPSSSPASPYTLPSHNASAPVLLLSPHHLPAHPHPLRSQSSPAAAKHIAFAPNLSVHTTWPAAVYDRRAEPATCNRLTPTLAQRIKEELNAFKMEEMEVHPTSRQLTHFFV